MALPVGLFLTCICLPPYSPTSSLSILVLNSLLSFFLFPLHLSSVIVTVAWSVCFPISPSLLQFPLQSLHFFSILFLCFSSSVVCNEKKGRRQVKDKYLNSHKCRETSSPFAHFSGLYLNPLTLRPQWQSLSGFTHELADVSFDKFQSLFLTLSQAGWINFRTAIKLLWLLQTQNKSNERKIF